MNHEPKNKKPCANCGHGVMWHRMKLGKYRCHFPKPGSATKPGLCDCADYVPKKKPKTR
ncbi:MAG TPA: hypothetical protein VEH49_07550 [Methylomirabilota bacterium]|nr:hypothetical protein [Methylomirabilota bacterium]